jgi:long-chain acyl-CoA synthetase
VPLNPIYTEDELTGPLQDTGAKIVLTLSAFYERMKACSAASRVKHVVATNIKEWFPSLLRVVFTLLLEKKMGHRATLRERSMAPRVARRSIANRCRRSTPRTRTTTRCC